MVDAVDTEIAGAVYTLLVHCWRWEQVNIP